jgi:hypothetical protein
MADIKSLVFCLALLQASMDAASAQDDQDAQRLDRMRFESAFADMIPLDRRLKVEVGSGPEGPGIRVIVDVGIAQDPRLLSAGQKGGDEYLMDVLLQSPSGRYFAVRCNGAGCMFSRSADDGYVIPGKLFVIPGDGCVYSTEQSGGTFNADSVRATHCLKNGTFEASEPAKGSDL